MSKKMVILAAVCAAFSSGIAWAHHGSSDVYGAGAMHARMSDPYSITSRTATPDLYTDGRDSTDVRGPCGDGK